ncbi:hypothetical protein FGO68_gene1930 [Halteria grandinella]|uniref:Uncharacterized protein n=1 Tax=Halteria grandinella TaxID=5974 RepID=A0A8J8T186_HALGN|nr:hypothetical protein FGO68_gene1930 [Halteria grandinella]
MDPSESTRTFATDSTVAASEDRRDDEEHKRSPISMEELRQEIAANDLKLASLMAEERRIEVESMQTIHQEQIETEKLWIHKYQESLDVKDKRLGEISESLAKLGQVEDTIADLENDMEEMEDFIAKLEKKVEGVKIDEEEPVVQGDDDDEKE